MRTLRSVGEQPHEGRDAARVGDRLRNVGVALGEPIHDEGRELGRPLVLGPHHRHKLQTGDEGAVVSIEMRCGEHLHAPRHELRR